MYILQVSPIATGLPENYFSYFSKDKVIIGTLVEIKVRNRKIFGIVTNVINAKNEKMTLKTQSFVLKKIERIVSDNFMSETSFEALKDVSLLTGVRESDILENFIPKFIFESPLIYLEKEIKKENIKTNNKSKALLLPISERIDYYKKEITKRLKNNESIVIFFPTINDLENLKKELSEDFKEFLISFNSQQTKKDQKENIDKLHKRKTFLILSTTSLLPFILVDKINLKKVIIEKESSYNYFTHSSKKQIDGRKIIKALTKNLNLDLLLSGEILSLESFNELNKNKIIESESKKHAKIKIIDMIKEKESRKKIDLEKRSIKISDESEEKYYKYSNVYFSKELIFKLENLREKKSGKVFLYTKRKGMSAETICQDCNSILKCEKCDKPFVLFKDKDNNTREYVCVGCKNKIELEKRENLLCKNCGSWRMSPIGIGVEGIEESLKEIGWKTFILDSKNAKTNKQVKDIIKEWQKEELSVLIGTDLAITSFSKNLEIDLASIISLDTLFSIPEMNIDEKILNLILEIKEKCNTKENILIQTRLADANVWQYVKENDYKKFLENEMNTRKALDLPPFKKILKFRLLEKELKIKNDIENLIEKIFKEEKLEKENISWWKEKTTKNYVAMIMIKKEFWEYEEDNKIYPTNLAKKMNQLLTSFKLEVDPVSIYK